MIKETITFPPVEYTLPAGEITIELFDAETGELQDKQKKTNYVNDRIMKAEQKITSRLPFSSGVNQYGAGYRNNQYFNAILLTDFAMQSDPNIENFPRGNVVGYGVRDAATLREDRGAFNAAESIFRADYIKLVFDFVTSQGNGTFQSIYSARMPRPDEYKLEPAALVNVSLPFSYDTMRKGQGSLFFRRGLDFWRLDAFDYIPNPTNYLDIPFTKKSLTSGNFWQWFPIGDEIYLCGWGYNQTKVVKFNWADPTVITEVKTLPFSGYHGIYDAENDQILYQESTAPYNVHVFDRTWTEIGIIPTNGLHGLTGVSADGLFLFIGANAMERATGKFYLLGTANQNTQYYDYIELNEFALYRTASNTTGLGICAGPAFFSKASLDTPVTKQSTQNMKITYEFNIPKLSFDLNWPTPPAV